MPTDRVLWTCSPFLGGEVSLAAAQVAEKGKLRSCSFHFHYFKGKSGYVDAADFSSVSFDFLRKEGLRNTC